MRRVYKLSLDEEFPAFRAELEGDLYSEYAPYYRKRAMDYIDVNAHFGTDDKRTRIIVGYQRNTYFSIVVAAVLSLGTLGLLFWSLFGELIAHRHFAPYISMLSIAFSLGIITTLYVTYVIARFANFKRNYIGVTVRSLEDDSYEELLDENYLYIMQNDERLQRRAESMCNRHAKGWFIGLFATLGDALLFGIVIAASFIYLVVAWYLIKFIWAFIREGLGIKSEASSGSYRDTDGIQEAAAPRLVLTGHGWNEYYEIDGKYITRHGRLTDYELHGREIWYTGAGSVKTVAIIEVDGSTGSVMYVNDWDGERIFERYEYKN